MPRGPDFAFSGWSSQAFVGPDVPSALTSEIRALVRADGRRSADEFPLSSFREVFAGDVPGTVAAIWATIMWCAYAPAFDGNEQLLSVFGEYLGRPLPGDEWVRWLPSPPLTALVTLYGERVRADAPRAALRLAALMADTAGILAADARFAPRAQALIAMLEPILRNPGLDHQTATGPLPAYRPPLAPQPRGTGPLTPPPVHRDTTFPRPRGRKSWTDHHRPLPRDLGMGAGRPLGRDLRPITASPGRDHGVGARRPLGRDLRLVAGSLGRGHGADRCGPIACRPSVGALHRPA
ncbi:hypothetical protein [Nonomuraea recticatena]|uniref:hypothetical protein n=1 Tax=Nonomuraea recticatena TaxID=46178 RepID=UPI00361B8941